MSSTAVNEPPLLVNGRKQLNWPSLVRFMSLLGFLFVFAYFSFADPIFLTYPNILNVLQQSAILAILGFGMTAVFISGGTHVISGGIDLSIANNLGLSAAVYASIIQNGGPDYVALPLTVLTGLAIGTINSWAVVGLGIFPLLATLATMNIAAGLELVVTQNTVVPASSPLLTLLASNSLLGVPNIVYILLLTAFVLTVLIDFTPFGLRLYATGGYRAAAVAAGISVRQYVIASYLLSGLCGSIAAVLSVSLLNGSSTGSGEILLSVVLVALLGVIFSRRNVPTVLGTLVSSLFIGFLVNGFQLTNVSSYWVNGVQGVLILLLIAGTSFAHRSDY
jgi:ribose transport system permease protein